MESDSKYGPAISYCFSLVYIYACFIGGGLFFDQCIRPKTYFADTLSHHLAAELPLYLLNILAYGCLVYVSTRPIFMLLDRIGEFIIRSFEKLGKT